MVKCVDCGMLCVRRVENRVLEEVEGRVRETWNLPDQPNMPYKLHEDSPLCFARVAEFICEIQELRTDQWTPSRVLTVLNRERECPSFGEWNQGFSPKEHVEMKQLDQQRLWQATREDADRLWRERQEDRQEHADRVNAESERNWRTDQARREFMYFCVTIAVAIFTGVFATIAAAIIGGLVERGFFL